MTNQIKVGDVVRLKSGSPAMTVNKIDIPASFGVSSGVQSAWCEWFNNGKMESSVFPLTSLTLDE
ncbi:hypothetical protein Apmu_0359_05 [Acidiphilium multivorum AIU301]|nr:DUF2158 domain-containing protein [Acidiphilium multivorum]GAN75433.1 hypothetical protein Apmu_0359_05 [Acidiphilium multivorum AIU301]